MSGIATSAHLVQRTSPVSTLSRQGSGSEFKVRIRKRSATPSSSQSSSPGLTESLLCGSSDTSSLDTVSSSYSPPSFRNAVPAVSSSLTTSPRGNETVRVRRKSSTKRHATAINEGHNGTEFEETVDEHVIPCEQERGKEKVRALARKLSVKRRQMEERNAASSMSHAPPQGVMEFLKMSFSAESNYLQEVQERRNRSASSKSNGSECHDSDVKDSLRADRLPKSVSPLSKEMIEELYGVIVDDETGNQDDVDDEIAEMVTSEVVSHFDEYIQNPFFDESSAKEPVILISEVECCRLNEAIRIMKEDYDGNFKNYKAMAMIEDMLMKQAQRASRFFDLKTIKSAGKMIDVSPSLTSKTTVTTVPRDDEQNNDRLKSKPRYSIAKCSRSWKSQLKTLRAKDSASDSIHRPYLQVPYTYECSRAIHASHALKLHARTCHKSQSMV